MQCVILAAGQGTRMGDVTKKCPKPMLPIKGRPKLVYTIETLPESIDEVIFIVGHLKEQIMNFFGKRYAGKKISYVEQKNLNGTGGAIMLVQDIVKGKFLVLMGDDLYLKSDLEKLLQNDMGLLAMEAEDASQCAVVKLTEDGALDSIIEVPHTDRKGLMNTGAYVLNEKHPPLPLPKDPCHFAKVFPDRF